MIVLDGVTKRFGTHLAVDRLSLEIPGKRIIGLLGPNGAGKTTLLRMLMGVLTPEAGRIELFGRYAPGEMAATRLIGYMPQQLAIYEGLSLRENVHFFGRLYGVEQSSLVTRCEEVLRRVELDARGDDIALSLSGGMLRRVMLATALIHKPQLLILDEPTAGVDPVLRLHFWAWFKDLCAEGTTILVTTHHISEAGQCDEVFFLRSGTLLERGTPAELNARYGVNDLEAAFVQATQAGSGNNAGEVG